MSVNTGNAGGGWAPIHKVSAAAVVGAVLWLVQWLVPAWRNNVPLDVQTLIPMVAGVVAAYLTKLEDRFIH